MSGWYRRTAEGWLLSLHIQPGAKNSAVAGLYGESLKIRLAAPAVNGRANTALTAFIAEQLGVPARAVQLLRGARSRVKMVLVADLRIDPARLLDQNFV